MKLRSTPLVLALALSFAACQRPPNPAEAEAEQRREEQLRALDERIAHLQDLEKQAAERAIAESERKALEAERRLTEIEKKVAASDRRASISEQEKQRLEKERQELLRERERLAEAQKKAEQQASEAERRAEEVARQANQERQERTMGLFYTALEPHGEWLEVGQYGYVWQPNAASNPRWRPYTEGRWVFSEYGWTWKSNEPFGWAAYHYGRWARLRGIGWVWVPGTEWGPAWVSWRRSDRYLGWAPLPPEAWSGSGFNEAVDSYYEIGPTSYTFVPVEEIGQSTYAGRAVEPERNVTIINQTVNVTNIKYTKVKNNTVVYNGGPVFNEINARSDQKVPQLNVERVTDIRSPKELGRAEQKGDTLVMAAPRIAPKKETERPVRVREAVKAPQVERGWSDIDKGAAAEARERFTKEARQAEERQRKGVPVKESRTVPVPESGKSASERAPRATPAERAPGKPVGAPEKAVAPATPAAKEAPATPRRKDAAGGRPAPAIEKIPAPEGASQKNTPPARQRLAKEKEAKTEAEIPAATPTQAGEEPEPKENGQRSRRIRRQGDQSNPAPAPAAIAPGEPVPGSLEPAADAPSEPTPERRLPKVKRARPGRDAAPAAPETGAAAAPVSKAEADPTPEEPPQGERKGKNRNGQRESREVQE